MNTQILLYGKESIYAQIPDPPDGIFTAMLEKSIEIIIDQLRELINTRLEKGTRGNEFEYLMPNAGRVFTPEAALKTLREILICHKRENLYRLNNYHYLLLYDTLYNYCEIHNDLVRTAADGREKKEVSDLGGFYVERIDFDDLIAMFFFDTDFLMDAETVVKLGLDKRKMLGIHGETFGISQGLVPHPEELELKRDDFDEYAGEEHPEFWSESSNVYPDMKASDGSSGQPW